MTRRFSEEMAAWRLARLKSTADQYAELPENFRAMMAKAARLRPELHLERLDRLTAEDRVALLTACKRLKGHLEKAWPLLIQANPPSLPI